MEAQTLKRKKSTISKGKIKKTIKNVICRPDSIPWPVTSDKETEEIKSLLSNYKVEIPQFKKLPWNALKLIPKSERPKPPQLKKVNGLIFGMSDCRSALQNEECAAILIEASVNPQAIVQPLIAKCLSSHTPVLCLPELKNVSSVSFGIATSCLGIQSCLKELVSKVQEISKTKGCDLLPNIKASTIVISNNDEIKVNKEDYSVTNLSVPTFSYLYRTNKKSRVFIPNNNSESHVAPELAGQEFIKVLNENNGNQSNGPKYMRMVLKKISNNPNRVKQKNKIRDNKLI